MKHRVAGIVALVCAACLNSHADEIQWHETFEAAQEAAERSSKPIMVDFWAPGCGWCDRLDEDTYSDPEVIAKAAEFESVKVNGRLRSDLETKYAIPGYPNIKFLAADGAVIHDVGGYVPPEAFVAEMDRALEAYDAFKKAAELEEQYAANPVDASLALQIAQAYRTCSQASKAAEYAAKAVELAGEDAEIRSEGLLIQGMSLTETGELEQAIPVLSAFVAENPQSEVIWDAKLYLGFCYLQLDQGAKGVPLLEDVVKNTPEEARAHVMATRLLQWHQMNAQ